VPVSIPDSASAHPNYDVFWALMSITLLDFIVLGVILLSAVLAMVRGFTREVLSIVSWAIAAVATIYFLPQIRDWVQTSLKLGNPMLANVVAGAGIFIITLIVVSLITSRLSDVILDSRIGPIDRTLGFFFGAGRGALLAVIAFLFFAWLVPTAAQPPWVQQAQSKPMLEGAGQALLALLPEDPEGTILKRLKGLPGSGGSDTDATDVPDTDPSRRETPPPNTRSELNGGYQAGERQNMQRLMDSSRNTAATAPAR